jgi:phosphotransferase system  glucose/maltose/N-acetylglucosamine-specific IIC component
MGSDANESRTERDMARIKTTHQASQRSSRWALAALVFAATAPAAYVAQRLYQRARSGEIDPSLILMSTHVDYLWRVAVATWIGGVAALLAVAWQARVEERASAATIAWIAVACAAATALLAWRFP